MSETRDDRDPAAAVGDSGPGGRGGGDGTCDGAEVFALRVLGDDMAPEFVDGDIIVVEPGGAVREGSFVLAQVDGEWVFRQLRRDGEADWALVALNPACRSLNPVALHSLDAVRGVVIQKAVPGRRRLSRFYI